MSETLATLADRLEAVLRQEEGGGERWAWSRDDLCMMLKREDRPVRAAVALLVERGVPVAASPRGGYYIATTAEEFRAAYCQCTTRIWALARKAKVFAQAAEDVESMQLILTLLPDDETEEAN